MQRGAAVFALCEERCAALERAEGMSCSDSARPSFPRGRRERRCGGLKKMVVPVAVCQQRC